MTRHIPQLSALLLLTGCVMGDAAYVCDYAWTFEDGVESGEYDRLEMSCSDYQDNGWQLVTSEGIGEDCEEVGLAEGALEVECTCEWVEGPLCNPGSVND